MDKQQVFEILEEYCSVEYEIFDQCDFYDSIVNPLMEKGIQVDYRTGASKGVLLFPDTNFVIKIPFINDESYKIDFCSREEEVYNQVLNHDANSSIKLAQFFLETSYLGTIGICPVYTQPRCDMITSFSSNSKNKKLMTSTSKLTSGVLVSYTPPDTWLAEVIRIKGEKVAIELLNFLEDYEIGDLHRNNVGKRKKNPIIFDYSSYESRGYDPNENYYYSNEEEEGEE